MSLFLGKSALLAHFFQTARPSFVENDRLPSFQGAPDGWWAVQYLELFLSFGSFPFRELVLSSRTPKGHNAGRWSANQIKC